MRELVREAHALGRAAEPSPFHTRLLARWLGFEGEGLAAVALEVADGVADFVPHAALAECFLVCVAGGVVELDASAARIEPQPSLSDEGWCRVHFGSIDGRAARRADQAAARARAAILRCADAVGCAEAALGAVRAHVGQRVVGGEPLAAKQAVRHRCADMWTDLTQAADAVLDAAQRVDAGRPEPEISLAASYAKATAVERCRRVTAAAHQLAGGAGILASAPYHRWYRRVKAIEPLLGSARRHRAAIAAAVLIGDGG
jgi:hypothetical protein